MPPKPSAAAGPRRSTPRATAQTANPRVAATKSAAKSAADASPETTPPSATATASPEPAPSLTCPKIGATPKSSPKTASKSNANDVPATTTPETTPLTSPETRTATKTSRKSTAEAVASKASSEELSEVLATAVPETTSGATTEIASSTESKSSLPESFSEKINETNLRSSEEPIAQNKTLAEKASEIAAIEAAVPDNVRERGQQSGFKAARDGASMTGARIVLKKTVRVVKKLVKKKVPKRVQKGRAVSSSEESGKVEVVDDESENPNPSVLGAMVDENRNSLEFDSLEVENLKPEPIASVSMEVENPNSDVAISMEAESPNSDPSAYITVGVENANSDLPGSIQVENPETEAAAGKENDSMNGNLSEAPVSDLVEAKNVGNEVEQAVSTTETHLGDQTSGLVGNQNYELETENVDSGGGEEGAKEVVGNFDVGALKGEGMGDGVVLSGEMEALERRKRRKTEIFIGGLDKDAKEEDIRKVFQEVGEIVEVRLMMSDKTGKNKGFAFLRYASAADAKKALVKFASVEICGKQCGAVPVEGNDTIFLGNIDKKWRSEDIVKLLQEIGIEKIDKVTVVANPSNIECNRGFAFLELETSRDAQTAYRKLQKKDIFGKHQKIKVAWAEPLSEPDEEEMLKVKSIYAEYLPSSWDEDKVKDYFKKFGEIENVVLAKNLRSSRRKDFAFVNYTSREAALACIESFNRESLNDEGSKVNVKVSLAKPLPKRKQVIHVSNLVSKQPPKEKMKAVQPVVKADQPRNKGKNSSSNYDDIRVDRRSSTTAELVQLLREQASWRQPQTGLGSVDLDYPYTSPARKRPFSVVGDDPLYLDTRGYSRTRFEPYFPAESPSYSGLSQGIGLTSLPSYDRQGAGYTSGTLACYSGCAFERQYEVLIYDDFHFGCQDHFMGQKIIPTICRQEDGILTMEVVVHIVDIDGRIHSRVYDAEK